MHRGEEDEEEYPLDENQAFADSSDAPCAEVMAGGQWVRNAQGEKVRLKKSSSNLERILRHDPCWADRLEFDEFRQTATLDRRPMTDEMERRAMVRISTKYEVEFSDQEVGKLMQAQARERPYDPIQDYLLGLEWDGVSRVDHWLEDCFDIENTELTRAYSRKFLISAVARVLSPGCKVDTVLVLVGGQGAGKTSTFATLFGSKWHSEMSVDIRSKDAVIGLSGSWCVEWSELDTLKRSQNTAMKSFISRDKDVLRPPYGRNSITIKRRVVFAGTTNDLGFLTDPTGSRRFWCVEVPDGFKADLAGLKANRDQLWAEAVHLYLPGIPGESSKDCTWWLTDEEEAMRIEASQKFESVDPWLDAVRDWIETHPSQDGYTATEILTRALDKNVSVVRRGDEQRLAAVLQALGYEKRQVRVDGARRYRWVSR